jgi:hypothetical protein
MLLLSNLVHQVKTNRTVQLVIAIVVIMSVLFFMNKQNEGIANTPIESAPFVSSSINNIADMSQATSQQDPMVYASPLTSAINEQAPYNVSEQEQQKLTQIADGTSPLTAQDLLPKYNEANNNVSKILQDQNFLISGFAQGIDTVGQNNKIAYNDIRSLPIIPKNDTISPWMMSPYSEAGLSRRPLE